MLWFNCFTDYVPVITSLKTVSYSAATPKYIPSMRLLLVDTFPNQCYNPWHI